MSTICEVLLAIKNRVCGIGGIQGMTNGWQSQVNQYTWDSLEPAIDDSITDIDLITGSLAPSYDPSDAGDENATVDTSNMSTDDMGDDACQRATDAYNEVCVNDPTDAGASGTALYELRDVLVKLKAQADPT